MTFGAPKFFTDLAAQGRTRNLVVLNLSGSNDSLSMLVPYNDPFYTSRRPSLAVPAAGQVLQIGTDSSQVALGLHPRLTGLRDIFNQGRLAFVQRTGYENQAGRQFGDAAQWQLPQGGAQLHLIGQPTRALRGVRLRADLRQRRHQS